jgi:hypothetical protein
VPRTFRLSTETNRYLTDLAARLGTSQTEALEVAVSHFWRRMKSGEEMPERGPAREMEARVFGEDEALARQWDRVADSYEADDTLRAGLREAMSRAARNTAARLRNEAVEE